MQKVCPLNVQNIQSQSTEQLPSSTLTYQTCHSNTFRTVFLVNGGLLEAFWVFEFLVLPPEKVAFFFFFFTTCPISVALFQTSESTLISDLPMDSKRSGVWLVDSNFPHFGRTNQSSVGGTENKNVM